jgi:NAD(P)-dependent dehydrogenase (short-subunit alcohol dehydrogenase family)
VAAQKVWFITGAGRGIGSDLASAALAAGHRVVATAQDAASVNDEVGEHDNLLALPLDVTDPALIDRAVGETLDRFGRIDVLVNNAGRFYAGYFETLSLKQVRSLMEVNFFGTLNVTRAVLPVMRKQRSGHLEHVHFNPARSRRLGGSLRIRLA